MKLKPILLSEHEHHDRLPDFGPWRLDPGSRVLYVVRPYRYEIDLDSCTSSAETLDWIMQISGKSWATDATLAGLVRALNAVLRPQATLCSFGQDKRLTPDQIAVLVREAAS